MVDRTTLRLSSALLAAGFVLYVVAGLLHTGGPANNHRVVFGDYARSSDWTVVHLGQFVGMAVIVAGLVVLQHALDIRAVGAAWTARLGAVCAAIALGLVLGLALALLGSAVAVTTRLPRTLGWLMVLSGLAYLVQGWVLGTEGFSGTDTFAILGGYLLILAWITWLVVLAWRTTEGHRGAAAEPVRAPGR